MNGLKRRIASIQLDANRINAGGKLANVSRLQKWADDEAIELSMAEEARQEASVGSSERRRKAFFMEGTLEFGHTPQEQALKREIEQILFPRGARNQNERNDVLIAFQAKKYLSILVTEDGNTLHHREELRRLGIEVMRDAEAVAYVEERIRARDGIARKIAKESGDPLPDWVGRDL